MCSTRVQAKTTKKVVLRLECTVCKYKMQLALKRCKQCVSSTDIARVHRIHVCVASSSAVRRRPRVLPLPSCVPSLSSCAFVYLTACMSVSLWSAFHMSLLCILVPLRLRPNTQVMQHSNISVMSGDLAVWCKYYYYSSLLPRFAVSVSFHSFY